jgi:hypothetical protein
MVGVLLEKANDDTLRFEYAEVSRSHQAIADFRAKLWALLPLASGTSIFLLLNREVETNAPLLLIPAGLFGATVTLGLYLYEKRGMDECLLLRRRGATLECQLGLSRHVARFRDNTPGFVGPQGAGPIVYFAVIAAWLFVAVHGVSVATTRTSRSRSLSDVAFGVAIVAAYSIAVRIAALALRRQRAEWDRSSAAQGRHQAMSGTKKPERWIERNKPWIETVGVAIGIAGVAFLTWQVLILNNQTRSLNEQLQQTYRNDTFTRSLELDKLRIDKPGKYEAVVAGAGDPVAFDEKSATAKDLAEARALAVYIADFFDYVLELYPVKEYPRLAPGDGLPNDDTYPSYLAWSNTIKDTFNYGSLLCTTLAKNQENYGTGFTSRLAEADLCGL